ncbi:MAG: peptidoglycan binding protein CsiV [Kangiellaceae bacterium]|nr:peptidoglycan binding protein CsiV [Kangiellaceae bacterium]
MNKQSQSWKQKCHLSSLSKFKKIVMASCCFPFLCAPLLAAQTNSPEDEQPRWFEVEVVIFKSTSLQGLLDESWNEDAVLELPGSMVDFLQPYQIVPADAALAELEDKSQLAQEKLSKSGHTETLVNSDSNSATTDLLPNSIESNSNSVQDTLAPQTAPNLTLAELRLAEQEKPFVLLDKEILKLNNEVASLNRHPEYKVIGHYAWRQPVLNQKEALNIRIAGGQDFALTYNYLGEKHLSHLDQVLDPFSDSVDFESADSGSQPGQTDLKAVTRPQFVETDNARTETYALTEISSEASLINNGEPSSLEQSKIDTPLIEQYVPSLWVPEIDGNIKVYLNRFLHVRTNLYLRRPDKKEIEAIDLNLFDNEKLANLTSVSGEVESSTLANSLNQTDEPAKGIFTQQPPTFVDDDLSTESGDSFTPSSFSESENEHQFSWEIGDDFLNTESQKMYIEKLFNYPMQQSRRVRSKELHYFDHPLFGMLIIITPYEKESVVDPNNLPPSI